MSAVEATKVFILGDFATVRDYIIKSDLSLLLSEHDLRICNLEGSFSYLQKPLLKAGPHLLLNYESLKKIEQKINLMSLANNHSMDFGCEGLETTKYLCSKQNIAVIGAGENIQEAFKPYDQGNARVFAFAENEFEGAGQNSYGIATTDHEDIIFDLIRQAKSDGKFVILIVHGGSEIIPIPSPYLVKRYRLFVKYGADVVIGMHPHVVQGYEQFETGLIYYSLGNFAFETGGFHGYQNADWSLGLSINTKTGSVCHYPIICSNGKIGLSDDKAHLLELERLSSYLNDSDMLNVLYNGISERLLPIWYRNMFPKDSIEAAVKLHYFSCDAHKNMIGRGLSLLLEEESHDEKCPAGIHICDKDKIWIFDKKNAPQATLNEYKNRMQMDCEEIEWLQSLVPGQEYMEIGSGYSTLYFSSYAKK